MIEILLSTYNGEIFLRDLLDSILKQTYQKWRLLIRDDGSKDNTVKIISEYQIKYPNKIFLIDSNSENIGSTLSFSKLIEICSEKYIMLCDQDDYWLSSKIEQSLNEIRRIENNQTNIPCMVFSDLKIVDNNLNTIAESFIDNQKLFPSIVNNYVKNTALNVVAGCTMIINRSAANLVAPIPTSKIIHDQWITVLISYYGIIKYLPVATILYRQHQTNVVGANKIDFKYFMNKIFFPIKQLNTYKELLSYLPFRVSLAKFLFYKLYFSIKRI